MLAELLLLSAGAALADEPTLDFGGAVSTDIRYRLSPITTGPWYQTFELPEGFVRSESRATFKLKARSGKAGLVTDFDLIYVGLPQPETVGDLALHEELDPFRIDARTMALQVRDLGLAGLDLKLGQQLVQWGTGDQFNPTNNLNADNLEDPLRFGEQLGNMMVRLDYNPLGWFTLTGVVVPVFKPALLPATGELSLAAIDRVPVDEDELRWRLLSEQNFARDSGAVLNPTIVSGTTVDLPDLTLGEMQEAVQFATSVGGQDVALSYYRGRSDFPVAAANHTVQEIYAEPHCNPDDSEDCINGMLHTNVTLAYPKMQVLGLNAAGQLNAFGWINPRVKPLGYRLEFAYIRPEETTIKLTNEAIDFGLIKTEAGEYEYELGEGERPVVSPGDDFMKWVVGVDYTITKYFYTNIQWVHGMPDEFGAGDWITAGEVVRAASTPVEDPALLACAFDRDGSTCATETLRPRIGDYLVAGFDVKLGSTLMRVFGIVDLTGVAVESYDADKGERVRKEYGWTTPEGRSIVLYPELSHNFLNGFELSAGALFLVGEPYTKFGDPASGGNLAFTRAKYSF